MHLDVYCYISSELDLPVGSVLHRAVHFPRCSIRTVRFGLGVGTAQFAARLPRDCTAADLTNLFTSSRTICRREHVLITVFMWLVYRCYNINDVQRILFDT